jgi:kynurenine formamidase
MVCPFISLGKKCMAEWKKRPAGSNWGEFGPDDQLGRLNLITSERRLAAIRTVTEGRVFSLSLPLDFPGGSSFVGGRTPPRIRAPKRTTGEWSYNFPFSRSNPLYNDVVCDEGVEFYTQYSTHWDALGHMGQEFDANGDGINEQVYYNGFEGGKHLIGPDEDGSVYAHALSIENASMSGIQGRGVLIDLADSFGSARVSVGFELLEPILKQATITIEPGDILCLYTGFADLVLAANKSPPEELKKQCAVLDGRDQRLLEWITDTGIAAICADNLGVEAVGLPPVGGERQPMMPLHEHCIFKLGIHLGELWYFGELAAWLRAHRRSCFLLTAPPLRLPGCVGSPVAPVATV